MKRKLAGQILATGKSLAPDRFPTVPADAKARDLVLDAWVAALGRVPLPDAVWPEAVVVWATELAGERMVTPRELTRAAYVVRDRWDVDPERRPLLDAHRLAVRNANYARAGLPPVEREDIEQLYAGSDGPAVALSPAPGGMSRLGDVTIGRNSK